MEYLKDINKKMGITVICNLHQVDVAIAYSKRIIGVNGGQIVFDGTPEELTQEKIHEIYGSEAGELITDISA
jgi:phosphonate transport system ATP-binding protein